MSSSYFRSWMDGPMMEEGGNLLTTAYATGISEFMKLPRNQEAANKGEDIKCPCSNCRNRVSVDVPNVWNHLYRYGFRTGYKVWYLHGERNYEYGSSSSNAPYFPDSVGEPTTQVDVGVSTEVDVGVSTIAMVRDNFQWDGYEGGRVEEPNLESRSFFNMLGAANQPLYSGCRDGHSPLSSATRMMNIKTNYNLSEDCVDAFAEFVKDILPEDNLAPGSYYEIQKLVAGLGLPYQVIDVCIDNCMIYWREDENRNKCKFCNKTRFQDTSGRVKIPFKRMWYLPLTERLKRLYESERTANSMRWHAEHRQDGDITHPSDAEAWKHFQSVYPDFACERRNVYIGLSTDGFNPFGKHGRKYSLWPVIVTPYNLPPSMCMRREFLFLSILVPGPDHPRRSLDIFLQPLICELQMLWEYGVTAFDVSIKQNFNMRVVLMWTISDFPAYGMLSGWSTHGRLACPYCQDNTSAFQLQHGRKTSWFDCHRCFLPDNHPYRRSRRHFKADVQVFHGPPPEIDGRSMLEQLRDFGAERTPKCGGNGHYPVDGCGEYHNWHKKSIFWDLPYWKDHLLRHNLDVMHVEKNFFDNIMNTVLNVPGKTKDNWKSRLDLPSICSRPSLHVKNGRLPMPAFRLDAGQKEVFFEWFKKFVKFPDGYASNLRNCVDSTEAKFIGMKSHDCHVVMQRLLPFVFAYLLPQPIHQAIGGVGAFFRDLCSRTLTTHGIRNLEANIPVVLCNLEKIFPPSFFDVMEHLAIHLPREAALGGPVQYRWMYPFERYMFHLKKKVKNLSKVEGSIVAQSINEEVSQFSEYYFPPAVSTKARRPPRHDDRGEKAVYDVVVPELFSQVGRPSGKAKKRRLSPQEVTHLHTYILRNCDEILEYERIYMSLAREYHRDKTDAELAVLKDEEFEKWLKCYVFDCIARAHPLPTWLLEFVQGLRSTAISYPQFCTRGYSFRIRKEGREPSTADYGISANSGDTMYYGILKEILEIRYPGMLNLRCIVFMCDWYDPSNGRGVRVDPLGVISINSSRKLPYYDPFILVSQADQVCYMPYPRAAYRTDPWITVTPINPRGKIYGVSEHDALQPSRSVPMSPVEEMDNIDLVVDVTYVGDDLVHSDEDETRGEFDDDSDSITSEGPSEDSE